MPRAWSASAGMAATVSGTKRPGRCLEPLPHCPLGSHGYLLADDVMDYGGEEVRVHLPMDGADPVHAEPSFRSLARR